MSICVVTGASGHVGANLVRLLLEKGSKVRVLVRKDTQAMDGLPVERFDGDLSDLGSLSACFKNAVTVFNCAGRISLTGLPDAGFESANIEGVRNVVRACLNAKVPKLIHVSSIHAFADPGGDEILDETKPLVSLNSHAWYDSSKAEGQRIVFAAACRELHTVIVNPSAVLGPFDFKPSSMGGFILDLCLGKIPLLVNAGYNWVDARDVADGILRAESHGRSGESYLLTGGWRTLEDLSLNIRNMTGIKTVTKAVPVPFAAIAARVNWTFCRLTGKMTKLTPFTIKTIQTHRFASSGKAERELGYKSRPFEDTIRDTVLWFQENGMLAWGDERDVLEKN